MTEAVFVAWLVAIGFLMLSGATTRLSRLGLVSLALPTGVATYILSGLLLVASPLSFTTLRALVIASILSGAVAAATLQGLDGPGRRKAARMLPFALGAVVASIALVSVIEHFPVTRVNTDSYRYLIAADTLERTGSLVELTYRDLSKRLLATPMLHTLGSATGRGYVVSITPLLALSGLGVVVWCCTEAFAFSRTPDRWRQALLAAGMVVLLTTNRFVYSIFYINGHLLFAVLALCGVGCAWLALTRRQTALLIPAALAIAALVPLRAESTIVAAFLLLPFLVPGRMNQRDAYLLITPFVLATIAWHGLALPRLAGQADPQMFGPSRGPLLLGIGLALLARVRTNRAGRLVAERGPLIGMMSALTFVTFSALRRPDVLLDSVRATGENLLRFGLWGTTWVILIPLFVVATRAVSFRFADVWTESILGFCATFFALPYLRGIAYRTGWYDSGNRMMLHILLLVVSYLIISGAEAIRASRVDESTVIDLARLEQMEPKAGTPAAPSGPIGVGRLGVHPQ